jgi:carboxymethylenebutenolidase
MKTSTTFGTSFALALLATACTVKQQPPVVDDHMSHMSAAELGAPRSAAGTSQGTPGLPPSAKTAAARLAASPRHVVVHEIFGLQTWVRGVADQVAADGFIAVAPDLLSLARGGPSTVELTGDSARKLIAGVSMAERNRGITAVANYAMSLPSAAPRYAVIGYCWGGQTTWGAAINNGKGFSGGVAFYGDFPYMTGPTLAADSMARISVPFMLLSGSKDARIGASMPAIDSMMKAMGKDYLGKNYVGAEHGFLRAQNDQKTPRDEATEAANMAATVDGWPRTIAFLRKNLGVK